MKFLVTDCIVRNFLKRFGMQLGKRSILNTEVKKSVQINHKRNNTYGDKYMPLNMISTRLFP